MARTRALAADFLVNVRFGVLFAPTLATAMRLTPAAVKIVQSGAMPKPIEVRLERKLPTPSTPKRLANRSFHVGVGLTHGCSLRCLYCHASAEGMTRMSRVLLKRTIDVAFQGARAAEGRTLSVSFAVGGEPTYHWPLFVEAVSEFRRRELEDADIKKVFLSMTTNGYYGRTKRRFVAQHFDHITLSLDGTPEIQNLHRPTLAAKGSYGKVAESLRDFLGARPRLRVGVRATVSSTLSTNCRRS